MQRLREELASLTQDPALSMTVPARQPFYLHLLSQSLRELGDPDWAILTQGEECFARGVPLGDETFGTCAASLSCKGQRETIG